METCSAIVVAGGSGKRFGGKKQFINLKGELVLKIAVKHFDIPEIDRIIVVVPEEDVEVMQSCLNGFNNEIKIVPGGKARHDSVMNGLDAAGNCDVVLIHDGVRPFITFNLIKKLIKGTRDADGCIPVLPVTDTIKIAENGFIMKTVPRENLFAVQTPQAFKMNKILDAHRMAMGRDYIPTDDSILIEESGGTVRMVEGERFNIKITLPEDMILAEAIYAFQNRNRI
ncbi:MAG TPA: 2-C-methyl-D-erythritol 4-phosphate cytidylyltransferase [Desulfomonilia bacterium]